MEIPGTQVRYLTIDDGSFQLFVLAGQNDLGILEIQGVFRTGMSWKDIGVFEKYDMLRPRPPG